MITVAERSKRCGRVGNGAGESPALPRGLCRCFGVWNGVADSAAVFFSFNTVIESKSLPKTLRHRYRRGNFKDFPACLTLKCRSPRVSKSDSRTLDVPPLLTRGLWHYVQAFLQLFFCLYIKFCGYNAASRGWSRQTRGEKK